ncbi:aldehyde dehydrogenase [Hortaea werneckii]|nr:aldehyde dehydrogenase [Hortaea werneckii]
MSPLQKDPQGRPFVPLFINGQPLPLTDSSRLYPVHSALSSSSSSSSEDEPIHYYASASLSDCAQACEAAWSAFNGTPTTSSSSADGAWKRSTVTTRRSLILRAADLLETRQDELIDAQIRETSCQRTWAATNISLTAGYMREIAARISSVLAGEIPPIEKRETFAFVFKEPVGPVLVIPPWNAAVVLATRAVTSAVAAGCTVVLKASELCPLTHGLIVEVFRQAGLPPGVLNSVQSVRGDAEVVTEGLVGDERIRKVEFIGSAAVGRKVAGLAAKYLKPVLMELGGKCPAIVLDDADLEKAAMLCAKGAVMHHGQICFSTERIIVLKSVAQRFQDLLVKAMADEPGGTAVHSGIAEKAQSILQDAKDHGNEFLVGGPEMAVENGLKPSIVLVDSKTNKDDLKIVDEETFGPSASLYVVEDDAEAIQLANRSAYGLNATIHSNMERALKMGRELEYGQVHVNSITVFTSWTGPQGGVKGSGWGRQNARWGMEEFLQEKFITYHGKDSG